MKKLLSLFLLLSPLLIFAQEVDADSILKINQDLSFIKKLDEDSELILDFKTISEAQFLAAKNNYNNKINFDAPKIKETEFSFSVFTKVGEFLYQHKEEYDGGDYLFCSYGGYLEPLNLYLIYKGNRIYEYVVGIDRLTGEKINLFEFSKHRHGGTCISKENNQLLFFSSFDEVGLESDISIYDLEKKERKDFFTEGWCIKELVWMDAHNLALKISTISEEEKEQVELLENSFQYLKATIIE